MRRYVEGAFTAKILVAELAGKIVYLCMITNFAAYKGCDVAVIRAGQSALEGGPQLFLRFEQIR